MYMGKWWSKWTIITCMETGKSFSNNDKTRWTRYSSDSILSMSISSARRDATTSLSSNKVLLCSLPSSPLRQNFKIPHVSTFFHSFDLRDTFFENKLLRFQSTPCGTTILTHLSFAIACSSLFRRNGAGGSLCLFSFLSHQVVGNLPLDCSSALTFALSDFPANRVTKRSLIFFIVCMGSTGVFK